VDGQSSGYAPRRTVLDKILVDAATAAGVEVREGFNVDSLLIEGGTVAGISGQAVLTVRAEVKQSVIETRLQPAGWS
jgi:flavin-dependent dehydrogenase